jgi:AraC family transcriptional regulator of adaptative response/methylated-DNA-[protein]-cysteine methyltransferase
VAGIIRIPGRLQSVQAADFARNGWPTSSEYAPKACLIGADREYEALVARIVGFVEVPHIGLDLPLDVRGTAFQQRVWRALRDIPPGETLCYAEIARRIGSPRAVRAVADACAANKLAVAIPCHRVVRKDGAPSGYAWGIKRKRALMDREAVGKV